MSGALSRFSTRRHFEARYVNVGRAMLGQLADMYGITIECAECWAREIDQQNNETPQRGVPRRTVAAAARAGMRQAGLASTGGPMRAVDIHLPNSRNATPFSTDAGGD